jgi:hypothetical protein
MSNTSYYLIVSAIGFGLATWTADHPVIQGFYIGVAMMVCIFNQKKWGNAAEAWARRKLGK